MPDPQPIMCPRCGYTLAGTIASWKHECPIHGACSECGLDIAWRDLLNPSFSLPLWNVETRRPGGRWPAQVIGTMVRTPPRLWRRIPLHYPPQWKRLSLYVLSLAIIAFVAIDLAVTRLALDWHVDASATSSATTAEVLARVAFLPGSSTAATSYGVTTTNGTLVMFPGPSPRDLWAHHVVRFWPVILMITITPVTIALAFAALPVARRRAKVRFPHIARVALYGAIVPAATLVFFAIGTVFADGAAVETVRGSGRDTAAAIAGVLFSGLWWYAAVRHYLRMERPLPVALAAVVIGLLAPLSIIWTLAQMLGSTGRI